jgi:hypothetical protein
MTRRFDHDKISDAKRVARGEHWLAARTFLRKRDRIHHAPWKIVTLAGHSPAEEIECIRELMPKAVIYAVDMDPECCRLAKEAGADHVLCLNLLDWSSDGSRVQKLPEAFHDLYPVDALNLDLCGGITRDMELIVQRYANLCRTGVFLLTFSYGRDVTEVYNSGNYRGIPDPLGGRVALLDRWPTQMNLTSVIAYRGNEMPMCALMWTKHGKNADHRDPYDYRSKQERWSEIIANRPEPSFVKIGDEDLAPACVYPDAAKLYATPAERIAAFRRKFAALKAVATRQHQEAPRSHDQIISLAMRLRDTSKDAWEKLQKVITALEKETPPP